MQREDTSGARRVRRKKSQSLECLECGALGQSIPASIDVCSQLETMGDEPAPAKDDRDGQCDDDGEQQAHATEVVNEPGEVLAEGESEAAERTHPDDAAADDVGRW